jgi:hypothetical protein
MRRRVLSWIVFSGCMAVVVFGNSPIVQTLIHGLGG